MFGHWAHRDFEGCPSSGYDRTRMIILSADTSTSYYSVAVCDDAHVLAEVSVDGDRKHSERLLESTDWVLRSCDLRLDDVEMLAIAHGPGSFTGLRIGVSAWKGLAVGADLPLVGVSTLDAMARLSGVREGCLCALMDAKMQEVYGAVYAFDGGVRTTVCRETVCPVEDLLGNLPADALFCGDGAALYRDRILHALPEANFADGVNDFPRASAVAAEALAALTRGASSNAAEVRPVYLRKSQAERMREVRTV